ncbi:uncharacterized protein LOC111365516 [Olea europaea var. sylvestris]|uniref:uncharacterized protein LOC111365516 n=1 Tax=Olea europaea var. sylvestris TaxID=158386 RepID=UPI000C1CE239|nr:uncharacterized protein LOC111365516 [Olea europaea var. sylvestris]
MKDDESFDEFYDKLNNIVNSNFNQGERIPESKIVRKVLRSLPKRFRPNVTTIEERKDLDTVKIEELKNKSIALNTVREGKSESSDVETLRDEEIACFVKKFQKVLKGKKWPQEKRREAPSKLQREKNDKSTAGNPGKKSQEVRCHECQGFGHYRNECPSFKKNLKKGSSKALAVSLTDDDSNSSEQSDSLSSEEENGYMAFVSTVKSESDKESEKVEEEESLKIKKVNKALFKKLDELEREKEKITYDLQVSSKNLSELKCVNEKLEDRVKILTCELEKSSTQLRSFVSGTKKLDDPLGMNKPAENRQGLGFVKSDSNVSSLSKTTFVPASNRSNVSTNSESKDKNFTGLKATRAHKISTPNFHDQHSHASKPRFIPTCHHCVTFGDGATAPIRGKGSISIAGLLTISNVLYVEGLKSNLLSISQICDADYEVSFVQKRCTVYDASGGVVLEGVRISDNCYGVLPNSNYVCSSAKIDMSELWHQMLDHVNYRSLSKLVKKKIVNGLPKIDQSENAVCKLCQQGKQLRMNHKRTLKFLTNRPLELLHMDLMGPSRGESLGGKRYILVVVDNFSRYTWIDLLRKNLRRVIWLRPYEGIKYEFSSPITPQQNGVVERKNIVLQEMARAMLHDKDLTMHFWGEAINTACRICYIMRDRENLGKFDSKSDDGIFLGYSKNSRVHRVYNLRTQSVLESVNVVIDDAFTEGESAENGVDIEDLSDDQGATAENKEQSIPKSPRS